MVRFLKDKMNPISLDLYGKILKPNKSYTNHIIQIVSCTTAWTIIYYLFIYLFFICKLTRDRDSTV